MEVKSRVEIVYCASVRGREMTDRQQASKDQQSKSNDLCI